MNKLCRQYLSETKALFPIMGREERNYLKKLSSTISEYCMEENVTSMDDLYHGIGQPSDIVYTYLSTMNIPHLIKRIQIAKWVKRTLAFLTLLALIAVSIFAITIYKEYQIFEQEQIFFEEEIIE